jgi:hypothetical protein
MLSFSKRLGRFHGLMSLLLAPGAKVYLRNGDGHIVSRNAGMSTGYEGLMGRFMVLAISNKLQS